MGISKGISIALMIWVIILIYEIRFHLKFFDEGVAIFSIYRNFAIFEPTIGLFSAQSSKS